jgi:hypothetical protein
VQNQIWRSSGVRLDAGTIRGKRPSANWPALADGYVTMSVESTRIVIDTLNKQIEALERTLLSLIKPTPMYPLLNTVVGTGPVLAAVIALEIGDIGRFPSASDFASYCRLVDSKRTSNNKNKGTGNRKNGNPYLAWAFMEAAQFALRYLPEAKRFYERKRRQRHMVLAKKALAHKIARARYRMLREHVPFEPARLFAARVIARPAQSRNKHGETTPTDCSAGRALYATVSRCASAPKALFAQC